MRHAIVNKDNMVVNVVLWEGAEWLPPRNHMVIRSDDCAIGDTYDPRSNSFIKPDRRTVEEPITVQITESK